MPKTAVGRLGLGGGLAPFLGILTHGCVRRYNARVNFLWNSGLRRSRYDSAFAF